MTYPSGGADGKNDHAAKYPGGSDTGIGWTYLRYPHVAATAWAGMLLLYQFDDDDAVDEDANPFAPPERPVPAPARHGRADDACLPPPAPPAAPGGAACSAHSGCKGLGGDCCPTAAGVSLGCCSARA